MKEGWTYKKLGEVCEILDSRRKPITKSKRETGTIPYYGATGLLDYVKDYIFDERLVLLGEDGAKWGSGENSSYIIEGKSWVNNHAHVLRPKRDILVDELLVYYLNFSNLLPYITGVTVPKLNQEKMRSIEIPIGPIDDQLSIVSNLDAAFAHIDALKANAEKQLAEARQLFQAELTECMRPKEGWEEKIFGDNCEVTDYVANGSFATLRENVKYYNEPNYAILVRLADYSSDFDKDKFVYVDKHAYHFLSKSSLKPGDIIMSNVGSIGKCFICPDLGQPMTIGPNSVLIKTPNNPFYLHYFRSGLFMDKLLKITNQATLSKFNKTQLRNMKVVVPPLSVQQSIVSRLDALSANIKKLEELKQKTLAECDALKQAMLREVFE